MRRARKRGSWAGPSEMRSSPAGREGAPVAARAESGRGPRGEESRPTGRLRLGGDRTSADGESSGFDTRV